MSKVVKVSCEACDTEYTITYDITSTTKDKPIYCSFCGEDLDIDEKETFEEEFPADWE